MKVIFTESIGEYEQGKTYDLEEKEAEKMIKDKHAIITNKKGK